jgi:hypothetical protein
MNLEEFITNCRLVVSRFDEWPYRPAHVEGEGLPGLKEDAVFIVVIDDLLFPVYADDKRLSAASILGVSKDEYIKAKEIVKRENAMPTV